MSEIVSLFSGCGGMDLGCIQAGGRVIWANDNDKYACQTYRHNIGDHIVEGDIADAFETMPRKADGVIGGFPCVDFSPLGKRAGLEGDKGRLYLWLVKAIQRCEPDWFIAENVPRLLSANDGEAWQEIRAAFSLPGYRLTPVLVNFADYGVPQRRRRLLIIGHTFEWLLPLPTHTRHVTAGEALLDIPPDAPNQEEKPLTETARHRLQFIGEGENLTSAFKRSEEVRALTNFKAPSFNDQYRRLARNRPSWCIAGKNGTGGGHGRFHWTEDRHCTIREIARLCGFPDDFEFLGSRGAQHNQLANAVPPSGIRRIARSLIRREDPATFLAINGRR